MSNVVGFEVTKASEIELPTDSKIFGKDSCSKCLIEAVAGL
jgi:hypothetical protein